MRFETIASIMKFKKYNSCNNIYLTLRECEYSSNTKHWKCRSILKDLICKSDRRFKPMEINKTLKSPIFCTSEVFLDHFRACLTLQTNGEPIFRWKRKKLISKNYNFKDFIFSEFPLNCQNDKISRKELIPSLYAITQHNHLLRIDLDNGEFLEDIYLSSTHKFVRINYNTLEEKFVVSTALKKTQDGRQLQLAVFTLYPFAFAYMLELSHLMFGMDMLQGSILNDCLIVSFKSGLIKIFSLLHILSSKYSHIENNFSKGESWKHGIRPTVFIKVLPPVLFEVTAPDSSLSLGGFPWHYVTPVVDRRNSFQVRNFESNAMAIGSPLDFGNDSIEDDMCYFHPDDSGLLIHVGSQIIRVIRLNTNVNNQHFLQEVFNIPAESIQKNTILQRSRSGRQIRRFIDSNAINDYSYRLIHSIIYDEDLRILVVAMVSRCVEGQAWIQLHENADGRLLLRIDLLEYWNQEHEHSIDFDLDTVVHIVKKSSGQEQLHVYRLQDINKTELFYANNHNNLLFDERTDDDTDIDNSL